MTSSFELSPHKPAIDPDQVDDLRRRLFGAKAAQLRVPGYTIEAELGRGAFGRVFRAFDSRFARHVALKIIRVDSPQTLLRVEREAQALARLSHPNVVQVYDKGPAGDDHYFLALEYLEGDSVEHWLRNGPHSVAEVVDIFLPVARALAAAHEAGLVHRDLKPANLMVASDGRVRLLDFGLARAATPTDAIDHTERPEEAATPTDKAADAGPAADGASSPSADSSRDGATTDRDAHLDTPLTIEGHFVGTPFYAAPEQHRGRADARSDQFSFCVAMYEALYGRRPFTLDRSQNIAEQLRSQRPSFNRSRGGTRVPRWLVAVLRRGLAHDPGARHPSMAAIAARLDHRTRVHPARMRLFGIAGGTTLATALAVGVAIETEPERIAECRELRQAPPAAWGTAIDTVASQSPELAADLREYADAWQTQHARVCNEPDVPTREAIDTCLARSRDAFGRLLDWLDHASPEAWQRLEAHPGPHPLADLLAPLPRPDQCVTTPQSAAPPERIEAWDQLLSARQQELAGETESAAQTAYETLGLARRLGDRRLEIAASYRSFILDQQRGESDRHVEPLRLIIAAKDAALPELTADVAVYVMEGVARGELGTRVGHRDPRTRELAAELGELTGDERVAPRTRGWLLAAHGMVLLSGVRDDRGAARQFTEALSLLRASGSSALTTSLIRLRAATVGGPTDQQEIAERIVEARAATRQRVRVLEGHPLEQAWTLAGAGDFFQRVNYNTLATDYYEQAATIFEREHREYPLLRVHYELAEIQATAAKRIYRGLSEPERDGEVESMLVRAYIEHRDEALRRALALQDALTRVRTEEASPTPGRLAALARIECGTMQIYALFPNCRAELIDTALRLNELCISLPGADNSCAAARRIWLKMIGRGMGAVEEPRECKPLGTLNMPE